MDGISNAKQLPVYTGVIGLGMTVFRILLALISVPIILSQKSNLSVAMIVLAIVVLDYYDGKMFRNSSFNESEKWRTIRRILDSCADRMSIQVVCIPLVIAQPNFLFPYIVICIKEIMTSVVCCRSFLDGYIIYPSTMARIATVFVGLTVVTQLIFGGILTYVCALILLFAGMESFRKYLISIKQFKMGMLTEGKGYERLR